VVVQRITQTGMSRANPKSAVGAFVFVFAFASLSGCEKQPAVSGLAESGTSGMMAMNAPQAPASSRPLRQSDTLAYEHTVAVELSKELLSARLREVEGACVADKTSGCTILEVSLRSNMDLPSGSIRMRLAPGGVDSLIDLASRDGKVTARSTQAEDLAQPVADTEREIALMTLHRDRLAEFMKSKELKVEQLIAVSKELATVQAQLDSLGTQRANLRRRIDTDLLTINMSLPMHAYAAEHSPVMDALRSFGSDFRQAIGQVIGFIAILVPWLVIIVPGIILMRLLWRWISRWIARRERRAAEGPA
jgi:hypothetical protein